MFIRKLDMLSPYITLYFKGERKHSSKFSGILSVFSYILVFFIGIYYIYDYIHSKVVQAFFFNRYIKDAGNYPLNSTSMFSYIQIVDKKSNLPLKFDFSVIKAIGTDQTLYDIYMNNPDLIYRRDHWLYGYCNNTDIEGIEDIIDHENLEKSICIKRFYDRKTKTYYNIGDKEFRWPILEKGCSNPNRTYYGVILQRCDKVPNFIKAQDVKCKNDSAISEFLSSYSIKFGIVDNIADILSFEKPLTKYINEITSTLSDGIFLINNLNFNPVKMLTHNGVVLDNILTEDSYIYSQNEKISIDASSLGRGQTTNGCLLSIYFWMQNNLQYYERINTKLQDILSDIGGIYSIIETIAYIINLLIHNFIIVLDTEDLVINRDSNNFNEKNRDKRPAILRRANQIMHPPKRQNILGKNIIHSEDKDDQSSSSQFQKTKENSDIFRNFKDSISNKKNIDNDLLNSFSKNNNIIDDNKHKYFRRSITKAIISDKNPFDFEKESKDEKQDKSSIKKNNNEKKGKFKNRKSIQDKIDEIDNRPIEKQNFTWLNYIRYLIFCGKNNSGISYYENFRAKLISEENIIQSYLDVYKLLDSQKFKIEKID